MGDPAAVYEGLSRFELFELFYLAREAGSTDLSNYITGLFAYLIVAYLAGKQLSLLQLIIGSLIYSVFMFATLIAMAGQFQQMLNLSEIVTGEEQGNLVYYFLIFLGFAWALSLGFVYDVRRKGKSGEST